MTLLKDGTWVEDPRLDRVHSGHTKHLEKYPLTLDTLPAERRAMPAGINWYSNFDNPRPIKVRGRTYQAIGDGDLGHVRGGHAICLVAWGVQEPIGWWRYYDQGVEGRCVEFAWARAQSIHNRVRYDITSRYPYFWMQEHDWWPGGAYLGATPHYEGTSVDAGAQYHHQVGPILGEYRGRPISLERAPQLVRPEHGIQAYRWATTWQMVRTALNIPDWMPGVPMDNSWGLSYPRRVLLLDVAGERVINEDGEFSLITDR